MADAVSINDPYEGLGSSAPTPTTADPYEGLGAATPPPAPANDPYGGLGTPPPAAPPLSEDDFQARLKTRWGPMLTGQKIASPADLVEMQSSGRFTPEQLQRVNTESQLRGLYIQEQAKTLGQKTGDVFSSAASGLGNMAQDIIPGVRPYQEYKELMANPSDVGTMRRQVVGSLLEGGSQAATGLLGLAKGLITGPVAAVGRAWNIGQPSPEQAYQNWKLDYLKTHAVSGFAPPPATSRMQDLGAALTGQPAESFAPQIPPVTSMASTLATLPVYGGATKVAAETIPGVLAATGLSGAAPTLSKIVSPSAPGAANAAKIRDAMNQAVEAAAGGAPPSLLDRAVGAVSSPLETTGKVVPPVVNAAGSAITGAGKLMAGIAQIPDNFTSWVAQKLSGSPTLSENLLKSGLLDKALVSSFGIFGANPLSAAIGIVRGLEPISKGLTGLGDFMSRVATADPTNPMGRLMALAADSTAPAWMREMAQSPALQFAVRAGNLGAGTAKGFLTGAATGAGISLVSGSSPEETGGNIAGMSLFGAMAGGMGARDAKIFQANLGAVGQYITGELDAGVSPDTLRLVPASEILQAALTSNFNPSWKIRFATAQDAGSPFAPGAEAAGQAGLYPTSGGNFFDPQNKILWVDPSKRAPGATLLHESFHPIYDNLVSQHPEIKDTLNAALAADGKTIDDFKQQYTTAASQDNPQAAAADLARRNSDNPDWAYPELLADSAAHELYGQDLLQAAQGNAVRQSATQTALSGISGWLSGQGVQLQSHADGTVFPDFEGVFTNPDVRKLTYKILQMQRQTALGNAAPESPGTPLTKMDMGNKKAPFYTTPQGQKINPYGQMVPDGKGGEKFVAWPASEIRKRAQAEVAARKQYFPVNQQITTMPAGLEADSRITPWTKAALRSIFDSIQAKNKLSLWYHRLNNENTSTSATGYANDVRRSLGNVQVSWQSGKPVSVEMTKKGNLITHWESEEAENQKLQAWSLRHGDLSLDLWGGDQAKVKADIQTYLQNHATGQPGDANGIGQQKRDVLNALLAGDNQEYQDKNPLRVKIRGADRAGVMRSLRVDRMETVIPESSERAPSNWESLKRNLSPAVQEMRPAIRQDDGEIIPGARGQTHGDIIQDAVKRGVLASGKRGFVNGQGQFLSREQAAQIAGRAGALHSQELAQLQGEPATAHFSPASGERDIKLTGPDGKKYPATYDGIQEGLPGEGWIQITPKVNLPGATVANSTTYHPTLEKKGFSIPPELYTELQKHLAATLNSSVPPLSSKAAGENSEAPTRAL